MGEVGNYLAVRTRLEKTERRANSETVITALASLRE